MYLLSEQSDIALEILSFLGLLPILYTSRVISATPVVLSCFNYTTNFCFTKSSSHLSMELRALRSTAFNMSVLGYSTDTSVESRDVKKFILSLSTPQNLFLLENSFSYQTVPPFTE